MNRENSLPINPCVGNLGDEAPPRVGVWGHVPQGRVFPTKELLLV